MWLPGMAMILSGLKSSWREIATALSMVIGSLAGLTAVATGNRWIVAIVGPTSVLCAIAFSHRRPRARASSSSDGRVVIDGGPPG